MLSLDGRYWKPYETTSVLSARHPTQHYSISDGAEAQIQQMQNTLATCNSYCFNPICVATYLHND